MGEMYLEVQRFKRYHIPKQQRTWHIGKRGDETGMPATIRDPCCNPEGQSPLGA